jgi:hypothetical protein
LYGVTVPFDVSDVVPKQSSKDVLAFHKHAWLRNRCVWCSLILVLVVAIIIALAVALSEATYKSKPPSKA